MSDAKRFGPAVPLDRVDAPRPTGTDAGYRAQLHALAGEHRLRTLAPRAGADFASNDYLALARHPAIVGAVRDALDHGVAIGSGGSRLLRGNDPAHEALEVDAAAFYGSEAALFFSSGYAANAALVATLPQADDLIVHDDLIHASVHEGMRLARCGRRGVAHNDAQAFDDAIAGWRRAGGRGHPWIAVESLYSMDGDRAPLADLAVVADRHDGWLLVDEAHATGVFGTAGRGLAENLAGRANVVVLRTLGKALGCEGALVCCPQAIRDFLVNRARAFIFSTAPSPLMAVAAAAAIRVAAQADDRREALRARWAHAAATLARHGVADTGTQILPLMIGDDARTMAAARRLQAGGHDVRGIRPPSVPPGTARLRISITLNVDAAAIDMLGDALDGALT